MEDRYIPINKLGSEIRKEKVRKFFGKVKSGIVKAGTELKSGGGAIKKFGNDMGSFAHGYYTKLKESDFTKRIVKNYRNKKKYERFI